MLRRALLSLLLIAGVNSSRGAEFMVGADISALPVFEGAGAVYRDDGAAGDVIGMFRNHGVNWYRLRLFVDPSTSNDDFVVNDLPYTLGLAQRVKAAGGKLLLDFHYSDTWADPGKQTKPSAWSGLSFANLTTRVHDYTRDTVAAFAAAGVSPQMVQIGNEISNGLLWSDGYPWSGGSHNAGFDRLATLLTAGINGAKDGAGDAAEPLIMLHHDKGANWGTAKFYFDKLASRGVDFDVIGYSYYPKFHYNPTTHAGSVDDLRETLAMSATTYNKPVVLVETGFASRGAQFESTYEFPVSEEGQREFLDAMIDAVEDVPGGLGGGVFWWYPEARPASGLAVWEGGRYGWFDQNGNLLSTIDAFARLNELRADFDGDGAVDGTDFLAWQRSLRITAGPANIVGDADGDLDVDADDLVVWQSEFGRTRLDGAGAEAKGIASNSTGASLAASVPEPSPVLLISVALVMHGDPRTLPKKRRRQRCPNASGE